MFEINFKFFYSLFLLFNFQRLRWSGLRLTTGRGGGGGKRHNVLGELSFSPTHITFEIIPTSTSLISLFKTALWVWHCVKSNNDFPLFNNSQHFHLLCLYEQGNSAKLQKEARCELNYWQPFLCQISPLKPVGPQSKQPLIERSLNRLCQ